MKNLIFYVAQKLFKLTFYSTNRASHQSQETSYNTKTQNYLYFARHN